MFPLPLAFGWAKMENDGSVVNWGPKSIQIPEPKVANIHQINLLEYCAQKI
jgi:hypothetical protein